MNYTQIQAITKKITTLYGLGFDDFKKETFINNTDFVDVPPFLDALADFAKTHNLTLIYSNCESEAFADLTKEIEHPVLCFNKTQGVWQPILIGNTWRGESYCHTFLSDGTCQNIIIENVNWAKWENNPDTSKNGQVIFATAFPMESSFSGDDSLYTTTKPLTPLQRTIRLIANEKKDIAYIYMYAIVAGLINLSLPLGIQSIISLISGGLVFSSVYVLVAMVVMGIILVGTLQIYQISLVEVLQRRVFTKASFELAFRIPRFQTEALLKYYPPELMNRFFDIITVQKSLSKVLLDLTAALLQILFGLLLLFFYHPFFIAFGLFTVLLIGILIRVSAAKGLETSLFESKYKYKVAQWLEDLARAINSFKLAGRTNLPVQKVDFLLNSYLKYRDKHFSVLKKMYINAVVFKTLVIGSLLIVGTILVVDRQITLGQFVASEIIMILVVGSVEKLINGIDVVFDLLTAVEKLGQVTDLPLEREGGYAIPKTEQGLHIRIKNLEYRYPDSEHNTLNGVDMELLPRQRIGITGNNGSGKETLFRILGGLYQQYSGSILLNGVSLRDLDLESLRHVVGKNVDYDDIFDGTILENITMGRSNISFVEITQILEALKIQEPISYLPEGLSTQMIAGGRKFSGSFIARIMLARCIVGKPALLLLQDPFQKIDKEERQELVDYVMNKEQPWSVLIISQDPAVMATCDEVHIMQKGKILNKN